MVAFIEAITLFENLFNLFEPVEYIFDKRRDFITLNGVYHNPLSGFIRIVNVQEVYQGNTLFVILKLFGYMSHSAHFLKLSHSILLVGLLFFIIFYFVSE